MKLTTQCTICNKPHVRDIDIDEITLGRILQRKELGLMIQEIIPHLTADEREFFMSGAHPACWDTLKEPDHD